MRTIQALAIGAFTAAVVYLLVFEDIPKGNAGWAIADALLIQLGILLLVLNEKGDLG